MLDGNSKLVPCPFCGDRMESFAGMTEDAFAKSSEGGFSINCDCGVLGPAGKTMEAAIAAWNDRAGRERDLIAVINEAIDYQMSFDWLNKARTAVGRNDDAV